jgi:hypothetical protein
MSIQLIPLTQSIAYYVPPTDRHTILLFYDPHQHDFAQALFLLFHEAGHKIQYKINSKIFHQMIDIPKGKVRQNFESESWQLARNLLEKFIKKQKLDSQLLQQFAQFADNAAKSYADVPS